MPFRNASPHFRFRSLSAPLRTAEPSLLITAYDSIVARRIALELRRMVALPGQDSPHGYIFASAGMRDRALEQVRSSFGWTSVEPSHE